MRVDSFTRGDSNDLGPGWYESEQAVGWIAINTNRLKLGDGNDGRSICYRTEAWAPNQSCSLKYLSTASGPLGGPAVRMSGVYSACYCYLAYTHSTGITLKKFVNQAIPTSGGGTDLGSTVTVVVASDIVKIEAIDTTIKVYINDIEKISVTDSSITTGKPGGVGQGWTTYWDDFIGIGDIKGLFAFTW